MINFDSMAAESARQIIRAAREEKNLKFSDADTRITSAMNILVEQGIYAMFLWLDEKDYRWITDPLNKFFKRTDHPLCLRNALPSHEACLELTDSLEKMFLAKQIIEQILTYARHMAKAEGGREKPQKNGKDAPA